MYHVSYTCIIHTCIYIYIYNCFIVYCKHVKYIHMHLYVYVLVILICLLVNINVVDNN